MLLARQLVRKADRQRHRVQRLVLPWSEVGDQWRRLGWLLLRQLVQEVQAVQRRRQQQARRQALWWRVMVDRHRRRAVQQALRR